MKRFKAHSWNITCLDVHPTEPYVLSVGLLDPIKMWDWNKGWECIRMFDMQGVLAHGIKFNPHDSYKFAAASMMNVQVQWRPEVLPPIILIDRIFELKSIIWQMQVWNFRSSRREFTLFGHGSAVSCFDYFTRGNQQYIITGSLDKTARVRHFNCKSIVIPLDHFLWKCRCNYFILLSQIWDCKSRTCVQILIGHMDCVTCVCSHPDLPILLTGSNDETVRLWNSITFK